MSLKNIANKHSLYILLGSIGVAIATFYTLDYFKTSPLKAEIQQLKAENNDLAIKNKQLLETQEEYKQSIDKLRNENSSLTDENNEILKNLSNLQKSYEASNKELTQLKEQKNKKLDHMAKLRQKFARHKKHTNKHTNKRTKTHKQDIAKKLYGIEKYKRELKDRCRKEYYSFVFNASSKEDRKYRRCLRKVEADIRQLKLKLHLAK